MENPQTGYLIPHTHWDREWRYPLWENRLYLRDFMVELLNTLEENPHYKSFLLDGQVVAAQDYLEICPEDRERLIALVRADRLQIGPWYTLPDLYPISGESMVRNLLRGRKEAEALGGCLNIGYESFGWGQPSQLPQIYQGFGIDTVIVSKNVDHSRAPHCEFRWTGADGTTVLATRLGDDARANFFMNAYLPIMTGKDYKSAQYAYQYPQDGQLFHLADSAGFCQDYFRLENTERIHREKIPAAAAKAWDAMRDTLLPDDRAMMDGTDSTTAQPQLMTLLEEINRACPERRLVASSLKEYVALLKSRLPLQSLVEVQGEMRDGPTTSLSGNALMTRAPLKTLNKKVQNLLFGMAEPLATCQTLLGEPYEGALLAKALDYLLLSHPHDSINGVTQDKTVQDVLYRLTQAKELAEVVYHRAQQQVLARLDYSGFEKNELIFVVFNPTPFPRREMLPATLDTPQANNIWDFEIETEDGIPCAIQRLARREAVSPVVHLHARPYPYYTDRHTVIFDTQEIPAGGWRLYRLKPAATFDRQTKFWAKTRKTAGEELAQGCDWLENEHLRVAIHADGSVGITDKKTGQTFAPMNYFEDTGDVGDYWMYYPPYENGTYTSKGQSARLSLVKNGPLSATVRAELDWLLPARASRPENYIRGESCRSKALLPVHIQIDYTLRKGSDQLEVALRVENQCRDHRLSVVFEPGSTSRVADAQGHFVVDHRDAEPLKDASGEYFNELTTQPMQNFVSVSDGERGLTVVAENLGEYELRKSGALACTLFRSVRNIICTEFRSAGDFPEQEGGQLLQTLCYHYALVPTARLSAGSMARRAQAFCLPLQPVQTSVPLHTGGVLPSTGSFYQLKGDVELSCLKRAEDGQGMILRVFNTTAEPQKASFRMFCAFSGACLCNLAEEPVSRLSLSEGVADFTVEPNKILTLRLWL